MKVKIGNRLYKMDYKEYLGLLDIAKEQVPFGIYALEKKDYAELRFDKCDSITKLKKMSRLFKSKGFTVLSNKGG